MTYIFPSLSVINKPSSLYSKDCFVFTKKKTQKVNFDKECVECKWCGFYNVFNRFHCSIELWRMVMNQVGRKNFVVKPPTFVPLGKSPVMRAIFAGPLLTPLFSRAAFSWRLVCESLPWEWVHGNFFCLCLGSFLWHFSSPMFPRRTDRSSASAQSFRLFIRWLWWV